MFSVEHLSIRIQKLSRTPKGRKSSTKHLKQFHGSPGVSPTTFHNSPGGALMCKLSAAKKGSSIMIQVNSNSTTALVGAELVARLWHLVQASCANLCSKFVKGCSLHCGVGVAVDGISQLPASVLPRSRLHIDRAAVDHEEQLVFANRKKNTGETRREGGGWP